MTPKCVAIALAGHEISGLVDDNRQLLACKITAYHWCCECGFQVHRDRYIRPGDVCPHLRALGMMPAVKDGAL